MIHHIYIGVQRGGEKGDRLPPKISRQLIEKVYFRNLYLWFKHIWLELLQKALKSDLKTRLKRLKIKKFLALGNPSPRG